MVLSQQEESLISVVRALPPAEAGKVLDWARRLADLASRRTVQWSDSWTDEDLSDATAAAVRRFEDQEREAWYKNRDAHGKHLLNAVKNGTVQVLTKEKLRARIAAPKKAGT